MADLENKQTKKYKVIPLVVGAANAQVQINTETDTGYDRVTGVLASSTNANGVNQSILELSINSKEIFPSGTIGNAQQPGFEVRNIVTGLEVAPDERFYSLDEKGDQTKVLGKYTDGGQAGVYPYTLFLYLREETESPRTKFRKLMTEFVEAIKAATKTA